MQLVAYGAQDVYLTGNPKVTFFQAVYKRHTNFAMENIEQTTNGNPSNNGRISVTVARNGDLIGDMYVELASKISATGSAAAEDCNWVAERAIKTAELSIGGQRIDKHYQRWWRMYSELYLDESKKANWGKLTTGSGTDCSAAFKIVDWRNNWSCSCCFCHSLANQKPMNRIISISSRRKGRRASGLEKFTVPKVCPPILIGTPM